MTKYFLHGGRQRSSSPQTTQYHKYIQALLKDTPNPARILFVFFAKPKELWNKLFFEYQKLVVEAAGERKLIFDLADEASFAFQVSKSDVIYIRGGSTKLLVETMKKFPNLPELWQGKIIAGSSAGANFLATYYYSSDSNRIEEGLGILPIKVFCHFYDEQTQPLAELKKHQESLPIYAMHEGEYVVIQW